MIRLLLLILLCLPLAGQAASPLVEARSRVSIVADIYHRLPVSRLPANPISVVIYSDEPLTEFTRYFKKYAKADPVNKAEAAKIKPNTPAVIVINGDDKALYTEARKLAERLTNVLAVVWFDAPANAKRIFTTALLTAEDTDGTTQAAAAQALFGGFDIKGADGKVIPRSRLGFAEPEDADMEADLERHIDQIVNSDINAFVPAFHGCQIVVARHGYVVIDKAYGSFGGSRNPAPVTDSTLYDVASLTKVLATVPAVMKLMDSGTLNMQSRPAEWLPRLRRDGLADLSVADYLYHRTGLPASVNIYKLLLDSTSCALFTAAMKEKNNLRRGTRLLKLKADGKINVESGLFAHERSEEYYIPVGKDMYASERAIARIDSAIYNAPLKGRKYLYSCLNFCVLKDLVEAASGVRFNRLVDKSVYAPIGAYHTCFRPSGQYPQSLIAPTEYDPYIRNQQLHGYVHDEIAAFSGGVQGNAGLFTTALDAAKLCQTWLQGGSYGGVEIFDPATVTLFTTAIDSISGRAPGFDLTSRTKSWRSTGASEHTYGHTGFTGTCCWIDPERDLVYIFLCNSIFPKRENPYFSSSKPREKILTTIIESIYNGKKDNPTEEEIETGTPEP